MLKSVALVNGTLWGVNVLLCLVVAVYAFHFLIFPENVDLLANLPVEKKRGPAGVVRRDPTRNKANYQSVWGLPNPIEKIVITPVKDGEIKTPNINLSTLLEIEGTSPNQDHPERAAAFLKFLPTGKSIFASYGKPILDPDGMPITQLTGIRIVEVYSKMVVFTVNGARVELSAKGEADSLTGASPVGFPVPGMPASGAAPAMPPGIGGHPAVAYDPANFGSKRVIVTADREVWEIDAKERDWVNQNQIYVLEQEVTVAPYADGGVKIDAIKGESVAAARGFMPNDVIKSVNGKPVQSLADGKMLANDPAIKNASTLIIVIDRAGKTIVMEYKLKK